MEAFEGGIGQSRSFVGGGIAKASNFTSPVKRASCSTRENGFVRTEEGKKRKSPFDGWRVCDGQ